MSKKLENIQRMESVIRASREIIEIKKLLRQSKWLQADLERFKFPNKSMNDIIYSLKTMLIKVENYIALRMKPILNPCFHFNCVITHFTQEEMDRGYHLIERQLDPPEEGEEPMYFDSEGNFVPYFERYALILQNGKVYPFSENGQSKVGKILKEASPV